MTQVVVAVSPESAGYDLSVEQSVLGPDVELIRHEFDGSECALAAACHATDVVLTDLAPLSRTVLQQAPQCRLISIAGTGFDCVDIDAAIDANISVCAVDGYCTDEVADHVMLLMLALVRRMTDYHDQVQIQHVWQFDSLTGLQPLRNLTLGIVGFGRIGRAVASRAQGFGMNILAHDHRPTKLATEDTNVHCCDFDTLLSESDIISLNCSMSPENRNLVDRSAFSRMSRRPILINCARGGLVDEAAMVDALDSGQISAAGLDVLADEPPTFPDSPFAGRSNVILTPHIAFYSDASMLECRKRSASNIRHFLNGEHEQVRKYVFQANG